MSFLASVGKLVSMPTSRLADGSSWRPSWKLLHRSLTSTQADHLKAWQKTCWNTYLSSGRGSDTLFRAIDSDHSHSISNKELRFFIDSVDHKGVHPRSFQMLDELAHDHQLSLKEFKSWLVLATKFAEDRNSSFALDYETHPKTGARAPPRAKPKMADAQHQQDDDSYHSWNEVTMNQAVRRMQYAVRGQVVMRADALEAQGRKILYTNIGNPQAVGQPPITYYRQVLALCDLPPEVGTEHPDIGRVFPADVVRRAQSIRSLLPSGTGAYSHSQGVLELRQDVADYISERDGGHSSFPGNIFLTNGASSAIEMVLTTLIDGDLDGVMIPIPQYPIYSALIAKLGGRQIGYELDESKGWAAPKEELEKRLESARKDGLDIKALALINPGNPTGQVYSRPELETLCLFCAEHGIVLLADEVYQKNVYAPNKKFISAKQVAIETPGCESLQLVSFHSTSKGFIGECGRRGGYMELHNIDPYVHSQLYKLASSGLCSNLPGQILTSLMVKPPLPDDESYDLFTQEEDMIFQGLKRRAEALVDGLNAVDGIECNPAEGAMYAFPRIYLPDGAMIAAREKDLTPDTLYALSLLEETGICVVPGSGFGQAEGRVGFRTTFLPPDDEMMGAIGLFETHHKLFCQKYG